MGKLAAFFAYVLFAATFLSWIVMLGGVAGMQAKCGGCEYGARAATSHSRRNRSGCSQVLAHTTQLRPPPPAPPPDLGRTINFKIVGEDFEGLVDGCGEWAAGWWEGGQGAPRRPPCCLGRQEQREAQGGEPWAAQVSPLPASATARPAAAADALACPPPPPQTPPPPPPGSGGPSGLSSSCSCCSAWPSAAACRACTSPSSSSWWVLPHSAALCRTCRRGGRGRVEPADGAAASAFPPAPHPQPPASPRLPACRRPWYLCA